VLLLPSPLHIPSMLSSPPSSSLCLTSPQSSELLKRWRALAIKWAGNKVREVGGENFEAEKGAEKSLGKGRGCVFGSSPNQLEWPHPELVHRWLLVHSSPNTQLRPLLTPYTI